jgi:hypothetical protein
MATPWLFLRLFNGENVSVEMGDPLCMAAPWLFRRRFDQEDVAIERPAHRAGSDAGAEWRAVLAA